MLPFEGFNQLLTEAGPAVFSRCFGVIDAEAPIKSGAARFCLRWRVSITTLTFYTRGETCPESKC